jgi:hypothetical protein
VAHAQRLNKGREVRLRIQVRVLKDGQSVLELEPQTFSKEFPELIDVSGDLTLTDLAPGDYTAEVEITDLLAAIGRNKLTAIAEFVVPPPSSQPVLSGALR